MDKLGQINNDNHTVYYRTHTKSKTKLPEPTTYSYQKKVESFFLCAFEHRIEIGRESFCELDPTISLLHFTIENGILYDYSKNGTYVNGKRVVHNVPLHEGDQICFAIHTIFDQRSFFQGSQRAFLHIDDSIDPYEADDLASCTSFFFSS